MNLLDLIILLFAAALALLGAARGLIRLLLAGAALGAAWWLATRFHQPLGERFFGATDGASGLAAFLLVLFLAAAAALVVARLIAGLVRATPLRWVDRVLGGLSGLVIATVLAAAFLLPLQAALSPPHPLLAGSALAPYLMRIATLLEPLVPEGVREALESPGGIGDFNERRVVGRQHRRFRGPDIYGVVPLARRDRWKLRKTSAGFPVIMPLARVIHEG